MKIGVVFSEQDCKAVLLQHLSTRMECLKTTRVQRSQNDSRWPQSALIAIKLLYQTGVTIILGIPHQQILVRELTVDATLSDSQTMLFLQSQAMHWFEQSAETLCFDYEILDVTSDQKKLIRVTAAYRSYIQTWQTLFSENNLPLHVIDVDTFALTRFNDFSKYPIINKTGLSDSALQDFSVAIGLGMWRASYEY